MITKLVEDIEEGLAVLRRTVNTVSATSGDVLHKLGIAAKLVDAGKALKEEDARLENVALVLDQIVSRIKITSVAENVSSEHVPGAAGFRNEVSVEELESVLRTAFKGLADYLILLLTHDIVEPDWKGDDVQLELTGNQAWDLMDLLLNASVQVSTTVATLPEAASEEDS